MPNNEESVPLSWDGAGGEWDTTSPSVEITLPQPKRDLEKLLSACGRGAACACGVTGGFLASHFGCAVSPIIAITTGLSGTALPYLSMVTSLGGTVLSVAVTTLSLTLWNRGWRRKAEEITRVPNLERAQRLQRNLDLNKTLTLGSALAGMVLTVGFNLLADPGRMQNMQLAVDSYNLQEANGMNDIGGQNKSPWDFFEDFLEMCGIQVDSAPAPSPLPQNQQSPGNGP